LTSKGTKHLIKISEKIASDLGVRYCTSCNLTRAAEGGKWIVYDNGLRRRWKCGSCVTAQANRKEK